MIAEEEDSAEVEDEDLVEAAEASEEEEVEGHSKVLLEFLLVNTVITRTWSIHACHRERITVQGHHTKSAKV